MHEYTVGLQPAGWVTVTATRRKRLLITAHLPPFCTDVVWIPMKVKATQIRLIGRVGRPGTSDWLLGPKDCYGHSGSDRSSRDPREVDRYCMLGR